YLLRFFIKTIIWDSQDFFKYLLSDASVKLIVIFI
ncbi:MAG: hypothetical protein ACJASR_002272, partial [Psychroserpens sp.]